MPPAPKIRVADGEGEGGFTRKSTGDQFKTRVRTTDDAEPARVAELEHNALGVDEVGRGRSPVLGDAHMEGQPRYLLASRV